MTTKKNKKIFSGIDLGNTSIKINIGDEILDNYENIYSYTSDIERKKNYDLNTKKLNKYNMKNNIDVDVNDGTETVKFTFEKYAEGQANAIKQRKNINKSDDMQLVRNSMVALANSLVTKELDNENWKETLGEEVSYDVYIGVGLPYKEYEIEGAKEKYREKFLRTFEITFANPSYPVKKVKINVLGVNVGIEGDAAIKQTIFEKELLDMKRKKELEGMVFQLIDIGCYSVDVLGGRIELDIDEDGEEYLGFNFLRSISQGISIGVGTALDKVIERIIKANPGISQHTVITRKDVTEAHKTGNGFIKGTKFAIEPHYTEELNKFVDDILTEILSQNDGSGYNEKFLNIYVAGGGSINDVIINRMNEEIKSKYGDGILKVSDNPIFANAKGYYNIAESNFGDN